MPDFDLDSALAPPTGGDGYSHKWIINLRIVVEGRTRAGQLGLMCRAMSGAEAAVGDDGVRGEIGQVGWDRGDDGEKAMTCSTEIRTQHEPITAVQAADFALALWNQEANRYLTPVQRNAIDNPTAEYWEDANA